mgnify:CR=1 FL=1
MPHYDNVMRLFHMLLSAGEPVTLLNTYRGFPVEHEATVLTLEQGYVAIGIHEHQAVCMALEGKTFIQNRRVPEVIRAVVMAVDVVKKRAVLTEFEPAGTDIGRRKEARVFPREPLEADIFDGRQHVSGMVADISTSGVGVFTSPPMCTATWPWKSTGRYLWISACRRPKPLSGFKAWSPAWRINKMPGCIAWVCTFSRTQKSSRCWKGIFRIAGKKPSVN